jgi:hypothetical protein
MLLVSALLLPFGTAPIAAQSGLVPRGTILNLILDISLDSEKAEVGDRFTATLAEDIVVDGNVRIRRGATVRGMVADVTDAGGLTGVSRKASMQLRFESIGTSLTVYTIGATLVSVYDPVAGLTGEDIRERDLDAKDRDARFSALFGNVSQRAMIGSIAGAVAILAPEGKELELEKGTGLRIRLDRDLNLSIT